MAGLHHQKQLLAQKTARSAARNDPENSPTWGRIRCSRPGDSAFERQSVIMAVSSGLGRPELEASLRAGVPGFPMTTYRPKRHLQRSSSKKFSGKWRVRGPQVVSSPGANFAGPGGFTSFENEVPESRRVGCGIPWPPWAPEAPIPTVPARSGHATQGWAVDKHRAFEVGTPRVWF